MKSATIKAYAKINLGLRIIGRRDDGYHELRTVYQSVSLADTVKVSIIPSRVRSRVSLECAGLPVPAGRDNLVVRAAELLCDELGLKLQIRIHLTKTIPTGGGLGGGSSDAAAVIRAIHLLTGQRMKWATQLHVAAQLGSDVPYFLIGGRALGVGRGEEVYALADGPPRHCVIALPDESMSTAEAYRLLAAKPLHGQSVPLGTPRKKLTRPAMHPTIESFCAALCAETMDSSATGGGHAPNDFEPLLFSRFPKLTQAKRSLLRAGAEWAALTGSGSAVYGLFKEMAQARQAGHQLEKSGMRLYLSRTVGRQRYNRAVQAD